MMHRTMFCMHSRKLGGFMQRLLLLEHRATEKSQLAGGGGGTCK